MKGNSKTSEDNKMNGGSMNVWDEKLKGLQREFPEVLSENQVDVEQLKKLVGVGNVAEGERYQFTWAGKTAAITEIKKRTTATLKPVKDESVNFDKTENIFIEGENLEVLRILQKSYYSKIKMIYIDPPYNTGNDFVYNDQFAESREDYEEKTGDVDEEGYKKRAFQKNSKEKGHYHSNWLNMMYPRLYLARNLLRDDGVIFVSIDDNEVHNLRMIMNEIFGEGNMEAQITWRRRHNQPNDKTKMIAKVSEYILVYSKDSRTLKEKQTFYGLALSDKRQSQYTNPDSDRRGPWSSKPWKAGKNQAGSKYEITTPTGVTYYEIWLGSKDTFEKLLKDNRVYFPDNGSGLPRKKYFLSERKNEGQMAHTFWDHNNFGSNQEASLEMEKLFDGKSIFENPKPVRLIKNLLNISTSDNDIILDFYAGSGTTAHAVMDLNAEDGGNRKYIMVQLPEETDEDSEARKAGFENIADIAKERIRRAAQKIKVDHKDDENFVPDEFDDGFKVFKLSDSNFKAWVREEIVDETVLQKKLEYVIDNVKKDSTEEAMLFELMLKLGIDPNTEVEKKEGYYSIKDGEYIICLAREINDELVNEILQANPHVVVCLDTAFNGNDELKTNTALQMKDKDIEFKVV